MFAPHLLRAGNRKVGRVREGPRQTLARRNRCASKRLACMGEGFEGFRARMRIYALGAGDFFLV